MSTQPDGLFQIKTLDKHSTFCFFLKKVLKTNRFFDMIFVIIICKARS